MSSRVPVALAAVALAACLSCGLAGCATGGSSSGSAPIPPAAAPLDVSVATSTAAWVIVPMGHLSDPLNTFWQVFARPAGSDRWSVVTPPGVADNGGLIASAPSASVFVVGFRPSQDLQFSPLAVTSTGGRSYSVQLVPSGLADVPDALAFSAAGNGAALVDGGADVFATTAEPGMSPPWASAFTDSGATAWQRVSTLTALASSPAVSGCGLDRLTAITVSGSVVVLGGDCARPGSVAIVERSGTRWQSVPITLPAGMAADRVDVLRLTASGTAVRALLRLTDGDRTTYATASAPSAKATWTVSAGLTFAADTPLVSTGITANAGFLVLAGKPGGALQLAESGARQPGWTSLPAPPTGTVSVAIAGQRIDALTVSSTRMVDFVLAADRGTWIKTQTVTVPIPFGSSS